MFRVQRTPKSFLIAFAFLVSLIFLSIPSEAPAAPHEMLIISDTAIGPTTALCQGGTTARPTQSKAVIQILDQSVYFTWHSPTATPSASLGGLAPANSFITVDRATDFRAIRVSSDARAYVVCIP